MKKVFIAALTCLTALMLSGCVQQEDGHSDSVRMEDHSWYMATVQSVEQNGGVIACGGGEKMDPDVPEIVLCCTADQGVLSIADQTNGRRYDGAYALSSSDEASAIYSVTIDGVEGMAVVSSVRYQDDTSVPMLIIRLGDYALNFFPESGLR